MLLRALRRLRPQLCVLAIASVKCRTDGVSHNLVDAKLRRAHTSRSFSFPLPVGEKPSVFRSPMQKRRRLPALGRIYESRALRNFTRFDIPSQLAYISALEVSLRATYPGRYVR